MFRRLFSRLFFNSMVVLLAAIGVFGLVLGNILSETQYQTVVRQMVEDAKDIAQNYNYLLNRQISGQVMADAISGVAEDSELWFIGRNGLTISVTGLGDEDAPAVVSDDTEEYVSQVAQSGQTIVLEGAYDQVFGIPIITVVTPLFNGEQQIGALFLHRSLSLIRLSLSNLLMMLYPGIFIAIGIGLLLSYTMTVRISKPLSDMSAAAKKLSMGDMSVRLDESSMEEVNELATTFNAMVDSLSNMEEMRRGFVANVSHELRSPITSIAGYLQGMLDGTIPESEHRRYMQVVYDETQRLSRLIRDLLDLSRIESGSVPLNPVDFDICELLRRVLIKFEGRLEGKNMELDMQMPDDPLYVHADVDRIEQVVSNLIDNAIKFCGQYGKITIGASAQNGILTLFVQDDGAGIKEEDLPHVFERFYKADKAHTSGLGTGLGLSIVKKILEQHGQRITVESKVGQGAKFSFTLALAKHARKEEKPARPEE